jgi:hypothetical protein
MSISSILTLYITNISTITSPTRTTEAQLNRENNLMTTLKREQLQNTEAVFFMLTINILSRVGGKRVKNDEF